MPGTGGPIRYEFGVLNDSHVMMTNTANEIGTEKQNWITAAGIASETWRDLANGRFQELNTAWDTAANSTNEFQLALASAVAQAQLNGEEALAAGVKAFS
jgi:hypothetical protein